MREGGQQIETKKLVSIIIDNYNYARFLRDAIDSAIAQTHDNVEVIVVDDGSTDESREIIAEYGDRVVAVLKENGGQASALNEGFEKSRGEIVVFLDSDDVLLPTAAERATEAFADASISKVHWQLRAIDENGARTGDLVPNGALQEGNIREEFIRYGPSSSTSPPTSGNAWARSFLDAVLPIPAESYRLSADYYLFSLAPLFGSIRAIPEPQSCYRLHGTNNYMSLSFDARLDKDLDAAHALGQAIAAHSQGLGIDIDFESWENQSWFENLDRARQQIAKLIPEQEHFILIDEDQWAMDITAGRYPIPFLARDGQYWGRPADDQAAIHELERLRKSGIRYVVVAWPAFWWLEYYTGFARHLWSMSSCLTRDDRLIVFDLGAST